MTRSRVRILVSSLALGLAAIAVAAPAGGAAGDNQWATVNICDTANHPNAIGIRARAPGNGTTQNIWMRFFVQQHNQNGTWTQVPNRMSPWVKLGSANFTWREAGRTFFFPNLAAGARLKLRGRVKIEYRKNGNVVRSATEITEGNHHAAGGGDPPHYSAATCTVVG